MRDDFDRKMLENGCTNNDLTTSAYKRVKEVLSRHPEVPYENGCPKMVEDAKLVMEQLGEYINTIRSGDTRLIESRDVRDALLCFRETLKAVKETFGEEKITETVICQAIEAGSYMGYRSIMGQAAQPYKK